ncbi:hypothetical protein F5Y08DRAFT_350351 [Xylaria arbuscula]|nr:hypothetical protein F5Y08DRAFT_350351 [Xylaria arbuscula]
MIVQMEAFVRAKASLEPTAQDSLRTLPQLVQYHAENNPNYLFCLQAEKRHVTEEPSRIQEITYSTLQQAILHCQLWLNSQVARAQVGTQSGHYTKPAPVALLMESDFGLAVYLLSLMGLGVPVVLLSARLSPLAIHNLTQVTGCQAILVSERLRHLCSDALSIHNESGSSDINEIVTTRQITTIGYKQFLEGDILNGTVALEGHFLSDEDRQVVILHSSGTSGLPKPIYCSHRHFIVFSQCEDFRSPAEAQGLNISTSPFFHGFGVVPLCLSLGIGKSFCIPPSSEIPTGASITDLIEESGAKSLMTVPSIIEEIALLPNDRGIKILQTLDFVAFGGGIPKTSIGEKLDAAGVKLINHYGATETGPLSPFYVPSLGSDWRYIRLRQDILDALKVKLEPIDEPGHSGQAYQLSMQPAGWKERFVLQDVLIERPGSEQKEFSIAGRMDDLICLATGEKVRPTILESCLRQQEGIKAAIAFGDKQFELGVIVETFEPLDDNQSEQLRKSLWPVIEEAGRQMDAHARITSPTMVMIVPPGSLPRSDKGTILRREVNKKFAIEIESIYQKLEASLLTAAFDTSAPEASIRSLIETNLDWRVTSGDWTNDQDFFELGMDSLQAVKLRRLLTASMKAAQVENGQEINSRVIEDDIVYRNSSVNKLARALINPDVTENAISEYQLMDHLIDEFSGRKLQAGSGATVLITGSTGSLGSFLLEELVRRPGVAQVVCLLRPSSEDPLQRQRDALKSRGISLSEEEWSKIQLHECSTSEPHFGLDETSYQQIASNLTHVLHIAWPMSFKQQLPSFKGAFRSLNNLLQLCGDAHRLRPWQKARLLFISSISTVGNSSTLSGETLVTEQATNDYGCALDLGYAKAKMVCERIIERAVDERPNIEAGFARVGQIAGAQNGYWNTDEHFVALVRSSKKALKFPDLHGTLSWLPVDTLATAIADIVLSERPLDLVYHLENPIRQSWQEMVAMLTKKLGMPASSIIPFEEWIDVINSLPEEGNPARALAEFLKANFQKMSCGEVILDTAVSRRASCTMRATRTVGDEQVKAYVEYWRKVGVLE